MYTFELGTTIPAPVEKVWQTWSDLETYPRWDPREEQLHLDGPFGEGTTGTFTQQGRGAGTFTQTDVRQGSGWTTRCPLPGGELRMDHVLAPASGNPGSTDVEKVYSVTGPLSVLFRVWYGRQIRRTLPASFTALSDEVARRA